MTQAQSPNPLRKKLLALMVLRVVLAFAFLGVAVWFLIREGSFVGPVFYPLHAIVITVGLLTIVYAALLKSFSNSKLFAYIQITVDIALITGIVYVTGAIESYLSTMYFLAIIGSSILLGRRGGFYSASASSIAFGVLVDLDFYQVLPEKYKILYSPVETGWEEAVTTIATHMLAFFTVAYLTGHLAEKTARMERELEEKEIDFGRLEHLNRHIVENIASGIMTLDSSRRITSFNLAAEKITGHTLRDVYYRGFDDIFPGSEKSDGVNWVGGVGGAGGAGSLTRFEMDFRSRAGEELHLGFSLSPGHGEDMAHIAIFQDLTRIKAMEEELKRDERLKALGEISASLAHEIRNPLASMSGSIQLLKEELGLKGERGRLMEIVLRETERLNALITDFLLFARPAQEKTDRVNVGDIITETLSMFGNCPEAGGIKVESSLDGEMFIEANGRQMSQVFWNLFLNAANAMPRGGVLSVAAGAGGAGGVGGVGGAGAGGERDTSTEPPPVKGFVEISVADTGEGIAPEILQKIFDPFYSTKEKGTGLGLAIAHRIVESHGGHIEVASEPGKGSVFKVSLPLSAAETMS